MARRFRVIQVAAIVLGLALIGVVIEWRWSHRSPVESFDAGMNAVERGNWAEVLRSADRLQGYPDFAAHEHLLRGIYCLRTDRPIEALSEVSALKPEGDLREPALLTAGEALYRTGRLAESQRLFATLASERPGHVEAHRWLGAIAYDLGAMTQAIDELEIVMRLQPTDYRPYLLKGHILYDQEQFVGAIEAYSHALTVESPSSVRQEILVSLARAKMRAREYSGAAENLTQADRTPETLAMQAECQSSLGNGEEAWKRIEEARALDPEDANVLRVWGRMELDAGRTEAAAKSLRKLLTQDPHDHESRHQFAQALRALGNSEEAEAESRRVQNTVELKQKLAALNVEAIKNPTDAGLRDRIASLCEELGKPRLAESWRKAAAACRQLTQASIK